jgi:hypothetical protein
MSGVEWGEMGEGEGAVRVAGHRKECLCHMSRRWRGRLRSTTHLDIGEPLMIASLVAPSSESEVAVKRFTGHPAQRAFRPKVKGWSEGT